MKKTRKGGVLLCILANNLRVLNVLAIYQVKNGDYFAIAFKEIVCKKSRERKGELLDFHKVRRKVLVIPDL